jgi:hypothetical protein
VIDTISALEELSKELQYMIDTRNDAVVSGGCKNFPEYTGMTGEVKGLSEAKSMVENLRRKVEKL